MCVQPCVCVCGCAGAGGEQGQHLAVREGRAPAKLSALQRVSCASDAAQSHSLLRGQAQGTRLTGETPPTHPHPAATPSTSHFVAACVRSSALHDRRMTQQG